MGRKRAQIMSRDAFSTIFVQAEFVMRQKLGGKIQDLIDNEVNDDIKFGLKQAQEIVFGKVETKDES